jgi:hypothetical protein
VSEPELEGSPQSATAVRLDSAKTAACTHGNALHLAANIEPPSSYSVLARWAVRYHYVLGFLGENDRETESSAKL